MRSPAVETKLRVRHKFMASGDSNSSPDMYGDLRAWDLDYAQLADAWVLLSGMLHPITRYATAEDARSSLESCVDIHGNSPPFPISLSVSSAIAAQLQVNQKVILRHPEGMAVAELQVIDIRPSATDAEASLIGGEISGVGEFPFRSFSDLHRILSVAPGDDRSTKRKLGLVTNSFPSFELVEGLRIAADELDSDLLVILTANVFDVGDSSEFAKVRAWLISLSEAGYQRRNLALLPVRSYFSADRDAMTASLIAKNFACTHLAAESTKGKREITAPVRYLAGPEPVTLPEIVATELDQTEIVEIVHEGLPMSINVYRSCVSDIKAAFPPPAEQGFTVFFTGLPASGKSTIANALAVKLMEVSNRKLTILDGDLVRKHLSSELGFSREHRDLNITRIGYVASEITKNGGVAICAPIAPFSGARSQARQLVSRSGKFIEIHVSTPVEVCEARDPKGLYAKARAGVIKGFTGVDDPYDIPEAPEMRIDTSEMNIDEAVEVIVQKLRQLDLLESP